MFKSVSTSIRANILVGVVLTIPIVTTLWILDLLITFATDWILALAGEHYQTLSAGWAGYAVRLLALLALLIVFYGVGVLVRSFLGRRLYALGDRIMGRIPIVKRVYLLMRQISESVFTQRDTLFKEVVLVEYPRKGLKALAFVTAPANEQLGEIVKDHVSLFIPTTPNPTSGIFIIAPRAEVTPVNMAVTDAIAFIISSGAVGPGTKSPTSPSLLDKLENWLHASNPKAVKNDDAPGA
ncbi:MAG: putative membrane protein [Candidatus Promineifilaceae bacterium]|jgi:uncharacterized membrane protein